jgi:Ser/Thr protein kinase RdoA (MazF antagonist)
VESQNNRLPASLRIPRPAVVVRKLRSLGKRAKPLTSLPWEGDVTAAYGLTLTEPVRVMEGGKRNESWVLATDRGRKILKRYKGSVEYEQILHEHSVLERLEAVHFPAPPVVRGRNGETVLALEGRYFALFDFLDGCSPFYNYYYLPPRLHPYLEAVGRNLALLHGALQDFAPNGYNIHGFQSVTGERYIKLDWYLDKLFGCREKASALPAGTAHPVSVDLLERAGWIEERLRTAEEDLKQANPARNEIHGDYGMYNLMLNAGQSLVTFDFELSRLDWRLLDLVFAISSATSLQRIEPEREKMRRILQGYRSISPIPVEEICLIPQVWEYQFLRRVIIAWERYLESGDGALLGEAKHRMARIDWVEQNLDLLSHLNA